MHKVLLITTIIIVSVTVACETGKHVDNGSTNASPSSRHSFWSRIMKFPILERAFGHPRPTKSTEEDDDTALDNIDENAYYNSGNSGESDDGRVKNGSEDYQYGDSTMATTTDKNKNHIQFILFTRNDPEVEKVIDIEQMTKADLLGLGFVPNAPTKIICHGFRSSFLGGPGKLLRPAYFAAAPGSQPINIILVDWSKYSGMHQKKAVTGQLISSPKKSRETRGVHGFFNEFYFPPAKKTERVGEKTADLLQFLIFEVGVPLEKIHLIGHSLGSHAMGTAGRKLNIPGKKLPRITGLDPASPCFEPRHKIHCPPGQYIALSSEDAEFVDIIHTSDTLGMKTAIGHVDFYPNGGTSQPGCSGHWFLKDAICSHHRSIELMAQTIRSKSPKPLAYACDSWDSFDFEERRCSSENQTTAILGEHCSPRSRGIFYLGASEKAPFFFSDKEPTLQRNQHV